MTDTIHKRIVDKIAELMASIDGKLTVETNAPLPEQIPEDGLVIVRDPVPLPTEETLGGFDTVYMIAAFPIEFYVTHGEQAERDRKYDELLAAGGGKMLQRDGDGQRTLGGLVHGIILHRPEPVTEGIAGAPAVKASTVKAHIEYTAPSALG